VSILAAVLVEMLLGLMAGFGAGFVRRRPALRLHAQH
jgi:hypothetical protein